jgi:glycosyltransferase involved in cell wall biosynthesis
MRVFEGRENLLEPLQADVQPLRDAPSPQLVLSAKGFLARTASRIATHGLISLVKQKPNLKRKAKVALGNCLPCGTVRERELAQLPCVTQWHPDDILLLPDSTWNQPGFFNAIQDLQSRPRIKGFIYDMIQLNRVDFVGIPIQKQFREWVTDVALNSCEVVCISRHTASEMQNFVNTLGLGSKAPKVRPIKFGNKITIAPTSASDAVFPALAGERDWILWLGSIDRRKNLDVVLLALEGLYSTGRLRRKFVVAGRPAGGAAELIHRMLHNPVLSENMVFIDSPDDNVVGGLMRKAGLFVFSSWSEGYGLPIAEALQYGVPTVASNATSIPEVAGDLVDYFDPWDSQALAGMLARFEADPAYRNDLKLRAARFVPTTWEETVADILEVPKKQEGIYSKT